MNGRLSDHEARQTALDGSRSFIVQAPAGSGKTELLIQRYLSLLKSVRQPEQIVAITFTRKAAAEMRARILQALRTAAFKDSKTIAGQLTTHRLARAAIKRDLELGWSLLEQPQRMRIDTLDALNAWLARQLPILSGGVAGSQIAENPVEQYRLAARRTLDRLPQDSELGSALRSVLPALSNSITRLEALLTALIPKRDQWLRHLGVSDEDALRVQLELSLTRLIDEELQSITDRWPDELTARLNPLLRHAASHSDEDAILQAAAVWLQSQQPPTKAADALVAWRGLAKLLLTNTGTWRRRFTKRQGFAPTHRDAKKELAELMELLQEDEPLRAALAFVAQLPDLHYTETQWQDLAALKTILTHLVAELRVIFAGQQTVDFVELALAAQHALGQVDEPSELLLALDLRIQHLLIDEFQDTSQSQLQLLELLTAGWQPGDGRSLFLVGDPMQSIYRFRDADMSLFLRVKQSGIANISCELLNLDSNFRSSPELVEWVNDSFAKIFPDHDQMGKGIARFYHSRSTREGSRTSGVTLHALRSDNANAEIEQVIRILELEQDRSTQQSIAILVQSRSHLLGLHDQLQAKAWPVHAIEIDALTERQFGQDLLGLCRALAHLGDRVAWLGLLRAPWCGLRWADLHALCADQWDRTIWDLMNDSERLQQLSTDGQRRLQGLCGVLTEALHRRGEESFSRWVERIWHALDGPSTLVRLEDFSKTHQFFDLLAEVSRGDDLDDPSILEEIFSRPQKQDDPPREAGIEIMTIHRAKGLEFNTVILFGLARAPRRDDSKALYWMEKLSQHGGSDLIMAPLSREQDLLTRFIRQVEQERDLAERARLLYVATTRARDRLHLVARLNTDQQAPAQRTMLACLWPQLENEFLASQIVQAGSSDDVTSAEPMLRRFTEGLDAAHQPSTVANDSTTPSQEYLQPEYEWAGHVAVHIGTVVHTYLHEFALTGIDAWNEDRVDALEPAIRRQLSLLGIGPDELHGAGSRVIAALHKVLQDPRAHWLLAPHTEAQSELRLTVYNASRLQHVQLDRTFVDEQGVRWIIDYKTSLHEGGQLDEFLDSEVARHRGQLEHYAQAMADIDKRPLRVGLYFPLLKAFRDWQPEIAN